MFAGTETGKRDSTRIVIICKLLMRSVIIVQDNLVNIIKTVVGNLVYTVINVISASDVYILRVCELIHFEGLVIIACTMLGQGPSVIVVVLKKFSVRIYPVAKHFSLK